MLQPEAITFVHSNRIDMPMDTIIDKLVKNKMADILEETLAYENDDTSVGQRQIAITVHMQ